MVCQSGGGGGREGAGLRLQRQEPKASRGVWGHAPPGKFGILYCVRHTEKYTHLKNEGAQPPFFQRGGGGLEPPLPPYFSAYEMVTVTDSIMDM